MMDFNQILLFASLGLGLLVIVFTLLGFLAGFKKEIKCFAIAFVLVLVALLVFGDPSLILNLDAKLLEGALTVPSSAKTIWDVVLATLQNMVPNGSSLIVDGTETYALVYALVSGVVRGVALLVGTLVMLILILFVNVTYRIISRIVTSVKAKNRRKNSKPVEEVPASSNNEGIVVVHSDGENVDGVVATASVKPRKKRSLDRLWGAVLGFVRAMVLLIIVFTPISGICSVLDEITPKTEQLIKDVLNGDYSVKTAGTDDYVDMAVDFRDAYYNSAVGKVVEGSSFFFKNSFSTHLFDGAFKIKLDDKSFALRDEIVVLLNAVNALEGNTNFANLSDEEIGGALDALKESNIIVNVIPAGIEVAYSLEVSGINVQDVLKAANQDEAFLSLRSENWKENVSHVLDAVKEVYKLGLLKSDFNFLTMDPQILHNAVDELTKATALVKILNIAIPTAVELDMVKELVGEIEIAFDMNTFDWNQEFNSFVNIYDTIQDLGITSLTDLDTNALVAEILSEPEKFDIVKSAVSQAFSLQLLNKLGLDVISNYVVALPTVKEYASEYVEDIKEIIHLLPNDVDHYLLAVKEALPLLDFSEGLTPKVDALNLDPVVLQKVVDELFNTQTLNKILPVGVHVALGLPAVKEMIGEYDLTIDANQINWKDDFTSFVDVYKEFLKLELESFDQFSDTDSILSFVQGVATDPVKNAALRAIFDNVAELGLVNYVGLPAGNAIVNTMMGEKDLVEFKDIIDLSKITADDLKSDFNSIVDILGLVDTVCDYKLSVENINLQADGTEAIATVLGKVLSLKLLGDDETKNSLVLAALNKFEVLPEEDLEQIDLSKIVWYNEIAALQEVVKYVTTVLYDENYGTDGEMVDGIDLAHSNFDVQKLLENDLLIDNVVELLNKVVDSELVIELMPGLLNKFVVPQLESFDDEDKTLESIVEKFSNETLVAEIANLADVLKAIMHLGVLDINEQGLQALQFDKTDDMRTIVNGIFDSKLIEGNEGKIIRILFRITKVFEDIEKGLLDGIDYDREQALLISAIDNLETVLKDEEFILFDENGTLSLDKEYYTRTATLNAAFGALESIFGAVLNVDGEFVDQLDENGLIGSILVEKLLPEAYDKYVKDILPDNLNDVISIVGLDEIQGATLMSDVRHIIYAARELVNVNVQSYLLENDYDFSNALEAVRNVLYAIFDTSFIKGNEAELVSYGLNKVVDMASLEVEITAEDFDGIDWNQEIEAICDILQGVLDLANANDLTSLSKVQSFVSNQSYLDKAYYTKENAEYIFAILENVVQLQTIDSVLPIVFDYAIDTLKDKGIDLSFLNKEQLTKEELVEDILTLVDFARVLVNEANVIDLYNSNFKGDLPEFEAVEHALNVLFGYGKDAEDNDYTGLNVLKGKEGDLLDFAVNKYLPENDYIKASDLDLFEEGLFDNTYELLINVLEKAFDLLDANNLYTVEDVTNFISSDLLKDESVINTSNVDRVSDIIALLADSVLVQQAVKAVLSNLADLEMITNIGDFSDLKNITREEIAHDIIVVSRLVQSAAGTNGVGALEYYFTNNIDNLDYDKVAGLVELVGTLSILENHAPELLPAGLGYVLETVGFAVEGLDASTFDGLELSKDFQSVAKAIRYIGEFLIEHNVDSIYDIINVVRHIDSGDLYTLSTDENIRTLYRVVKEIINLQLVRMMSLPLYNKAIDVAGENGFEVAFMKDGMTGAKLVADLNTIVDTLYTSNIMFDFVAFAKNDFMSEIPSEETVVYILDNIFSLNILEAIDNSSVVKKKIAPTNTKFNQLLTFAVENFMPANDFVSAENFDFSEYVFAFDYNELKQVIGIVYDLFDANLIDTVQDILDMVKVGNFINSTYINDTNVTLVTDLIKHILNMEIVRQALNGVTRNIVTSDLVKPYGDFSALADLADEADNGMSYIVKDAYTLVDIIVDVAYCGVIDYLLTNEIDPIDFDAISSVVAKFGELNIFTKHGDVVLSEGLNYVVANVLGMEEKAEFTTEDFAFDYKQEFETLSKVVDEFGFLLYKMNLVSVGRIMQFINKQLYLEYYQYVNKGNVDQLGVVANKAVESNILKAGLVAGIGIGVDFAANAGYDVRFLMENITIDELRDDVDTLISVGKTLVEVFQGLDLDYTTGALNGPLPNSEIVIDIVSKLLKLNIITGNEVNLIEFAVNSFLPENEFISKDDFDFDSYENDNDFDKIVTIVEEVMNILNHNNLTTIPAILSFINNREYLDLELIDAENVQSVANIIASLDFDLVKQAAAGVVRNLTNNQAIKDMIDISCLAEVSKDDFGFGDSSEFDIIAEILVAAYDSGLVELALNYKGLDASRDMLDELHLPETIDSIQEILTLVGSLNFANKYESELAAPVINYLLNKVLSVDTTFSASDFTSFSWDAEFAQLNNILDALDNVLYEINFHTALEALTFVENGDYANYKDYLTTELVYSAVDLLREVVDSNIAIYGAACALPYVLNLANVEGLDVDKLLEGVTVQSLHEDFENISDVIDILVVDAKVVDILLDNYKDEYVTYDKVEEALTKLFGISLLKGKMGMILEIGMQFVPANDFVSASDFDFTDYDFDADLDTLLTIISYVYDILWNNNLLTVGNVMKFINKGHYTDLVLSKSSNGYIVADMIEELGNIVLVQMAGESVLNNIYNIEPIANIGDFSKLDDITGADLAHDLAVLADTVRHITDSGAIDYFRTATIETFKFEDAALAVENLGNLVIFEKAGASIVANGINYALLLLGITGVEEFIPGDFNGSHFFKDEFKTFADVVRAIGDVSFDLNIHSTDDLHEFVNNKWYLDDVVLTDPQNFNNVTAVIRKLLESKIIKRASSAGLIYGLNMVKSIIDLSFIADDVTSDDIMADIDTLIQLAEKAFDANAVGYVLFEGELVAENMDALEQAIVNLFDLNIISGGDKLSRAISLGLDLVGITVSVADLNTINWDQEQDTLKDILHSIYQLTQANDLVTLDSVKTLVNELTTSIEYTPQLEGIANSAVEIVKHVLALQLVEKVAFPASSSFLSSEELAGLADIHNIYDDYAELKGDLLKVIDIVDCILDLNPYAIYTSELPIPYDNVQAVRRILDDILSTAYLNKDGRIEALVTKFAPQVEGVDYVGLDLASDALALGDAYNELLVILNDEYFPVKYVSDLNSFIINLNYWLKPKYIDAALGAVKKIFDTTLVEATDGGIIFLALVALPYSGIIEALKLDELQPEDLLADIETIVTVADNILNSGDVNTIINDAVELRIFSEKFEELVVENVPLLLGLNILANKYEDVAIAALEEFNGVEIGGFVINKDAYNFADTDIHADLLTLVSAYSDVCGYARNNSINDAYELLAHFQSIDIKAELSNSDTLDTVISLLEKVVGLSIVRYNTLALYSEFGEGLLEGQLGAYQDLAALDVIYTGDHADEDLHDDLVSLVQIIKDAKAFGLVEILNGGDINYDQAELVKDILNNALGLNYLVYNMDAVLDVASDFAPFDISQLEANDFDLRNDGIVIGNIYEVLIPLLTSHEFPYKNLESFNSVPSTDTIYTLIYDNQSLLDDVVINIADISFLTAGIRLAYNEYNGLVPEEYSEYLDIIDIMNIEDEDLRDDIRKLSEVLSDVAELNILNYVFFNNDVFVNSSEDINSLVNHVLELNMISTNFAELVYTTANKFLSIELDTTNVYTADEASVITSVISQVVTLANQNGIDSISTGIDFAKQSVDQMINTFLEDSDLVIVATIIEMLTDSKLVENNAKMIASKYLVDLVPGEDLKEIVKFDKYVSNEQFVEDIKTLSIVFKHLVKTTLNEAYLDNTVVIDFENVEFNYAIEALFNLNAISIYANDLVAYVDSLIPAISLSSLDLSETDFASVGVALSDVYTAFKPITKLAEFPYSTFGSLSSVPTTEDLFALVLAAQNDLAYVVEELADVSFVPAVVKAVYDSFDEKIPADFSSFAEIVDVMGMNDELLRADVKQLGNILRAATKLGVLETVINGDNLMLDNADKINNLINEVFDLNIVNNNAIDLIEDALDLYFLIKIDTTNVTVEQEIQMVKNVVNEVVAILNDNLIASLDEVKAFAQLDTNTIIRTLIDDEDLVNICDILSAITDNLDGSVLVRNNALTVAKEFLPGLVKDEQLSDILTLSLYEEHTFIEDVNTIVKVLRNVILSNLNEAYKDQSLAINYSDINISNAIVSFFELNALSLYSNQIVAYVDSLVEVLDLSSLSLSINPSDGYSVAYAYEALAEITKKSSFPYPTFASFSTPLTEATIKALVLESQAELATVIEKVSDVSFVPAVVKVVYDSFDEKIPADFNSFAEIVDVMGMDEELLRADINQLGDILRAATKLGVLETVINGDNLMLDNADKVNRVINEVFDLNIVSDNVIALIDEALNLYFLVDLDTYGVIAEHEKEVINKVVELVVDVLNDNLIASLDEIKAFAGQGVNTIINTLIDDEDLINVCDILSAITNPTDGSEIVRNNGLSIVSNILPNYISDSDLSEIARLLKYDNNEVLFVEDVNTLVGVLRDIISSNLNEAYLNKDLEIDYASEYIPQAITNLFSIKFVSLYINDLIAYADKLVAGIDLSELSYVESEVAADGVILANTYSALVPVLTATTFQYKTVNSFTSGSLFIDLLYKTVYNGQDDIANAVAELAQLSVLPKLVKVAYANFSDKIPANILDFVNIIDIPNMSEDDLREDLEALAYILLDVKNINVLDYVFFNNDVFVTDSADINSLIDHVFSLNMVSDHFNELVAKAAEKYLGVALEVTDVTVESEIEAIKNVINELVVVMNRPDNDLNSISKITNFMKLSVSEMINLFVKDDEDLISACDIVNDLTGMKLVENNLLTVARKYLPGVTSDADIKNILKLEKYNNTTFNEDVASLSQVLRGLIASNLNEAYADKMLAIDYCDANITSAIENLFKLNAVKFYQNDILAVVDNKVSAISLDNVTLDITNEDAERIAELYEILNDITLNDAFPYVTFDSFKTKLSNAAVKVLVLESQDILANALDKVAEISFVPAVVKAVYGSFEDKIPASIKGLVDILDIKNVEDEYLRDDLAKLGNILRKATDLGVLEYALNKEDIMINDATVINDLINSVLELNLISDNYVELVEKAASDYAKVIVVADDSSVALETPVINQLVAYLVELLNVNGIDSLEDVKTFVKNDVNTIVNTFLDDEDLTIVASIVETLGLSVIVSDNLRTILGDKLPGVVKVSMISDIVKFDKVDDEQFMSDVVALASIIRDVRDSNINEAYLDKDLDIVYQSESIPTIIEKVFATQLVRAYINDVVAYIDTLVNPLDLSTVEFTPGDVNGDGVVLANVYRELVPMLELSTFQYNTFNSFSNTVIQKNALLNTIYYSQSEIANALTAVAGLSVLGDLIKATYSTYESKLPAKVAAVLGEVKLAEMTDSDLSNDVKNLAVVLNDVKQLDILNYVFFSEDIEFTSAEDINNLLTHLFALNLVSGHFDKVVQKAASEYLSVALDVNGVTASSELEGLKNAVSELVVVANRADNNLNSINKVKDFIKLSNNDKINMFVQEDADLISICNIIDALTEMKLVENNGLIFARKYLPGLTKDNDLKAVLELAKYDTVTFNDDLSTLTNVIRHLVETNLNEAYADKTLVIDYEHSGFAQAIEQLFSISFFNMYDGELVDYVSKLVKNTKIAFNEYDPEAVDFALDAEAISKFYAEIAKILVTDSIKLHTFEQIEGAIKNKKIKVTKTILGYESGSHLQVALEQLVDTTLVKELMAVGMTSAANFVPTAFKHVFNISGLSKDELAMDYASIVEAFDLVLIAEHNDGNFTRNLPITKTAELNAALDIILNLNILEGKYATLVANLLHEAKIDTSVIDLSSVDWAQEIQLVEDFVAAALDVFISLDVDTVKEVLDYSKNVLKSVSADLKLSKSQFKAKEYKQAIKTAMATVKAELNVVDRDRLVDAITTALNSSVLANILVPVYNQKVHLTGTLATVADLHTYGSDTSVVHDDLVLLASAIRSFHESGAYSVISSRTLPEKEQAVAKLEDMVRDICSLTILDVKVQDLPAIMSRIAKAAKINSDFASLATISFADDKEIYASLVSDGYEFINGLLSTGIKLDILGEENAMEAFVNIVEKLLTTEFGIRLYDECINAVADKLPGGFALNVNTEMSRNSFVDMLRQMLVLGVFSNNGIDFTNKDAVKTMFDDLYSIVIVPSKYTKIINGFVNNIDAYGLVPFAWTGLSAKSEYSIIRDLASRAVKLVRAHSSEISSRNFAFLSDTDVRTEIIDLGNKAVTSGIIRQVFMPVMEGTYRAVTRKYGDGEMILPEETTPNDVINTCIPTILDAVQLIDDITGFNFSHINYYQFDKFADLVDVIAADDILRDNLPELGRYALAVFGKKRISDDNFVKLESLDMETEAKYVSLVLRKLQEVYDATPFDLSTSSLLNADVLRGIADALEILCNPLPAMVHPGLATQNESKIISVFGVELIKLAFDKVFTDADLAELNESFKANLEDSEYDIVSDMKKVVKVIRLVCDSNLLVAKTDITLWVFSAINGETKLIETVLSLDLVKNNEKQILDKLCEFIPTIKDTYAPELIANNEEARAEIIALFKAIETISSVDLNNTQAIVNDLLNGTSTIDMAVLTKSVILKEFIVEQFNNQTPDYISDITVSEIDEITSSMNDEEINEFWDNEFKAMGTLIDYIDNPSVNTLTGNDIKAIYKDTILLNKILNDNAQNVLRNLGFLADYYSDTNASTNVITSTWTDTNWKNELELLFDAIIAIGDKSISTLSEPIVVEAGVIKLNIDSTLLVDLTRSAVLREVFADEVHSKIDSMSIKLNVSGDTLLVIKNKVDAEYPTYSDNDKRAIEASLWTTEFENITKVQNLVSNITYADTLTGAYISDIYYDTTFIKAIFNDSAKVILTSMPIVGDTYSVEGASLDAEGWALEMNYLMATFKQVGDKSINSLNDPLAEDFDAEILVKFTESSILTQVVVNIINDILVDPYEVTTSDFDEITTKEQWTTELTRLRSLKNLVETPSADLGLGLAVELYYGTVSEPAILTKNLMNRFSINIVERIDIINGYYNNDDADLTNDMNEAELAILMNLVREVNNVTPAITMNDIFTNPLSTLDGKGAILVAATESAVLRKEMADALEDNVKASVPEAYKGNVVITEELFTAVNETSDPVSQWNKEITNLTAFVTLVSSEPTLPELLAFASTVNDSVIAKTIINSIIGL